jgi:hypothetical protein
MSTSALGEFDAAKMIVETLRAFEKDKAKQEQVLRWVAESLGISAPLSQLVGGTSGGGAYTGAGVGIGAGVGGTGAGSQSVSAGGIPGTGGANIKSFVDSKQPKSDNQFATVVAYYHRFVAPPNERMDDIDGDVLQDAARKAPWDRFKRPDKTLGNAVAQGYLDRIGGGRFRINSVGENLVAMTLPGSGNSNERRNKKRSKKSNGAPKGGKAKGKS